VPACWCRLLAAETAESTRGFVSIRPGSTFPCSCPAAIPARGTGDTHRAHHSDDFRHVYETVGCVKMPFWCIKRLQWPFLDPEPPIPAFTSVACATAFRNRWSLDCHGAWATGVLRHLVIPLQPRHECDCLGFASGVYTIRVNPSTCRCLTTPGCLTKEVGSWPLIQISSRLVRCRLKGDTCSLSL
jgi:hypothetical protein